MSKQTPTHLVKQRTYKFKNYDKKVHYKTDLIYFCGRARNLTISTENIEQVTCEKCLAYFPKAVTND